MEGPGLRTDEAFERSTVTGGGTWSSESRRGDAVALPHHRTILATRPDAKV
jgi:hypothetical protein